MCKSNENFAGSIRNSTGINAVQVGGGGMGTLFEYAIYKEFFKNKKIKNIVMFFHLNDLDNLREEKNNQILLNYMNQSNFTQNIYSKKSEIDKVMENEYFKFRKNKKKLLIKRFIKVHHTRDYIKSLVFREEATLFSTYILDEELLNLVISIYKKLRSEFDGNLFIAYNPSAGDFIGTDDHKKQLKQIRLKIIKKLRENNFKVINFYESLSKENAIDILPFGENVKAENHFSEYGHKVIANDILQNLKMITD